LRGRYHLFVQSVRGGKPIQLTEGAWSVGSFSFLPDGRILYSATPHPEDDFSQVMESDLFEVSPDGGKSKRITKFNGTLDQVSAWSKDRLVALGSDLAKSWASPQSLWWVERKGGKTERIAPDWDRSITDSMNCDCRFPSRNHAPWISPDKKTTIVGVTAGSSVRLAKVGLEDSKVEMVTPSDCSVLGWHTTPDGSLRAEIRSSMNTFPELWFTTPEGSFKATRHNDTLMASKRILKPVNLSFKASDGKTVEAWLVLPRRRQRKPAPLILAIHGGPKTVYGHAMMMEFQMLAGAGYGVLFLNPRGSDGYGTDWAHAVFGAYGERDYQDLMEGVDHALAGGWNLDAHRLGVQGGSYGGFMTNWIVGHTNRFKAAVTQRGISDFSSFYGTSDIGFFFGPEQIGGTPWENPERYSEKSPLTHMVDVKAATLIIHSENDLRCPIGQADQLYAQLRIQGSTVQMARFPEETHELSRTGSPNRKMERLRLLLGWFRKHL
ncbi:S9 family peptidase, partial [bacterium]|nr:S9 family peptidase [bacterium]